MFITPGSLGLIDSMVRKKKNNYNSKANMPLQIFNSVLENNTYLYLAFHYFVVHVISPSDVIIMERIK